MADNYDGLVPTGSPPAGTAIETFRSKETAGGQVAHVIIDDGTGTRLATIPVSMVAAPLPTGAATDATLLDIETALAPLAGTLPISAAALPLPPDAATQTTLSAVLAQLQATLDVALTPDARNAALSSIEIALSGTPGTVTTVTIPDTAQGVRLYPRSNAVRFAIGEDPAAVGASSATTIAAAAFGVGGVAKADMWETRLLAAGTSRTVRLRSAIASVIIDMEVF